MPDPAERTSVRWHTRPDWWDELTFSATTSDAKFPFISGFKKVKDDFDQRVGEPASPVILEPTIGRLTLEIALDKVPREHVRQFEAILDMIRQRVIEEARKGSGRPPDDIKGRGPIISPFSVSEPRQPLPMAPAGPSDPDLWGDAPAEPPTWGPRDLAWGSPLDPLPTDADVVPAHPEPAIAPYREGLLLKSIDEKMNSVFEPEFITLVDPCEHDEAFQVPINNPGEPRCRECGGYAAFGQCYYCHTYPGGFLGRSGSVRVADRMKQALVNTGHKSRV